MTHRGEPETLGEALRQAREDAHLSQKALAEKLGVSGRKTVLLWEKDKHVPTGDHRRQLTLELNLTPGFFEEWTSGEAEEGRLGHRVAALERAVALIEQRLFGADAALGR